MEFTAGHRLLHYDIREKLGEGGMGAVYRATDTKLGREVALKVLPAAFTADPDRLARFDREARILAALEHPNIAGIHEIAEAQLPAPLGSDSSEEPSIVHFLVMQLAPGENLASRLERGPIPLMESLPIAKQVAEALEAAHGRGIAHRDLKPANIMVAADGSVKVLDFGLAKIREPFFYESSSLSQSPTLTDQMTRAGAILGTVGYMSPEQARGYEADWRSDVWSFGVVLWEMLTGARLFSGDTLSDSLAQVLMVDPDWRVLQGELPRPILYLLRRCLERDVKKRLQAIGEARIVMEEFLADPALETSASLDNASSTSATEKAVRAALWILVGICLGWILSMVAGRVTEGGLTSEALQYTINPAAASRFMPSSSLWGLDISRDGRLVAFIGRRANDPESMVFLKISEQAEPRAIAGTEGAVQPFFSPDAKWVGYFTARELRKIPLAGGIAQTLAAVTNPRGGVWHPDGSIYYAPDTVSPILQVSDTGGQPRPVTKLEETGSKERTHRWPAILPDGKGLLFTSDNFDSTEYFDDAQIDLWDLVSGERKTLIKGASRALYSPSGHLLFARDGAAYAVGFDLKTKEVLGAPVLALPDVAALDSTGAAEFSISGQGTLAYIPGGKVVGLFELLWISRTGRTEPASSLPPSYRQVALSPSGKQAVLTDFNHVLWLLDLEGDTTSRITFEAPAAEPVWFPDGHSVFFTSGLDLALGKPYRKAVDGSTDAELVWDSPGAPTDVSADGRWMAVDFETRGVRRPGQEIGPEAVASQSGEPEVSVSSDYDTDIWIVDLSGEETPKPFFEDPEALGRGGTFSPDGHWLAYVSDEGGLPNIYVRRFPAATGKWQVTTAGGTEPRWSSDGQSLYYRNFDGIHFVSIEAGDGFRIGRSELLEGSGAGTFQDNMSYDVAPVTGSVLALRARQDTSDSRPIHVIVNYSSQIEALRNPE